MEIESRRKAAAHCPANLYAIAWLAMPGKTNSPSNSAPTELPPHWTSQWKRALRSRLARWYRESARDLPWRANRDPYRVWVSEVMLQQTQVATVKEYFARFVERFPSVRVLASAPESVVLRYWEGLGYYRRARHLHQAAQRIVADHGGQLPDRREELQRLPGIGRYTAGAILSIAFDKKEPILEANTRRLLSRLLLLRCDPDSAEGQSLLWRAADDILPDTNVGLCNQALMELGSSVCASGSPDCTNCPLREICPACQNGVQNAIPIIKSRPAVVDVVEVAVIVRRRGQVLLVRYGAKQRWAGLWDFPRFAVSLPPALAEPVERTIPSLAHDKVRTDLVQGVSQSAGVVVEPLRHFLTLRHRVTRFRIRLECFEASYCRRGPQPTTGIETAWVAPSDWDEYPCHSSGRRIRQHMLKEIQTHRPRRRITRPLK
jgi:A/G-specific adenine glycosylase